MSIQSERDLLGLLRIGKIVGLTLEEMRAKLRPGVTTQELDLLAAAILRQHGARSAPYITYQFPGTTCISLNDEAAHGIPGSRVIREGDLVKLDVSAELDGYFADAALTVAIPPVSAAAQKLLDGANAALEAAINAARAGHAINQIGRAAETTAHRYGLRIVRELTGHGVGRGLHEDPRAVPNFYVPSATRPLTDGLVIAVEPHLTTGRGRLDTDANGWTIRTRDRQPVANFEHTIAIMGDEPIRLTALQSGG
ncbi:MAG TPA: type I methionyl aminopeptidase [Aggregatilineales bacterium]|nr:type I methionyl aminopeptidase [Aggregatilineales bacterium]